MKDFNLFRILVYALLCIFYVMIIANMKLLVRSFLPHIWLAGFLMMMLYSYVRHVS